MPKSQSRWVGMMDRLWVQLLQAVSGPVLTWTPTRRASTTPGLSLLLLLLAPSFAPCVSTHRKTSKAFFFLFLFSTWPSTFLSARLADTLPHHLLARAVNFSIAPARLLIQCVPLCCCWAVLCARHVRPTRRVFSVSTASARRTTTARRNIYARESIEKFATRRATICASRYSIIIIR